MASQPLPRYTLEEYLELEDRLEYGSEFHDGVVLPVESATPTHARLGSRVGAIIEKIYASCATFDSSLSLYIPSVNRIVHPDATVVCGKASYPKPDCIDNPMVLIEITSPTTKDYDYGTKREYYFSLPSLQHYLLISQTEALVGHFEKSAEAWIYMDRGADSIISLGSEISVPVSEIYSKILAS